MAKYACGCSPLCDACIAQQLSWFAGIAWNRGEDWARAVANVLPIDRPWPRTAKAREVARRKAGKLTSDQRLLELLTDRVELGAARWWNRALERAG